MLMAQGFYSFLFYCIHTAAGGSETSLLTKTHENGIIFSDTGQNLIRNLTPYYLVDLNTRLKGQ